MISFDLFFVYYTVWLAHLVPGGRHATPLDLPLPSYSLAEKSPTGTAFGEGPHWGQFGGEQLDHLPAKAASRLGDYLQQVRV